MTKQAEIREEFAKDYCGFISQEYCIASDCPSNGCLCKEAWKYADTRLQYLHSQGVVIKKEGESLLCECCDGAGLIGGAGINDCCPECNGTGKMFCVGYTLTEPLIKEE